MNDGISPRGRPTNYKGILMRSRLEAKWAKRWDNALIPWEYEPLAFGDEADQYLPDFRITHRRQTFYVEVKGELQEPWPVLRRMETVWSSEPYVGLLLVAEKPAYYCIGANTTEVEPWWIVNGLYPLAS